MLRANASSTSPRALQSCARICEVDDGYQQHEYRDGQQGHRGGAVALGHVVPCHVLGVVSLVQITQADISIVRIFDIRAVEHIVERVQQGLHAFILFGPKLHVAGVAPFRGIVDPVVPDIDQQLVVHAGVVGEVLVDSHYAPGVPSVVLGLELDVLSDRRLISEHPPGSPLGDDGRTRSAVSGGVALHELEGEYPEQVEVSLGVPDSDSRDVGVGFLEITGAVLVIPVAGHRLDLREIAFQLLYDWSGNSNTVHPRRRRVGILQPHDLVRIRIP